MANRSRPYVSCRLGPGPLQVRAGEATRLSVGALLRQEPAASLVVEIWCSLANAKRFELTIKQCTEAGADIIRPLVERASKKASKASAERGWT